MNLDRRDVLVGLGLTVLAPITVAAEAVPTVILVEGQRIYLTAREREFLSRHPFPKGERITRTAVARHLHGV